MNQETQPQNRLIAEKLREDPRLVQAKQTLLDLIKEYGKELTEIKPSDPARAVSYHELLASLEQLRGAPTFYPYLGSGFGYGALVELLDGSVKYDCITGIGVHFLGHSHPLLVNAALTASLENTLMQGHLQQNLITVGVLRLLSEISGFPYCFLSTSGAMANENALKIAFQARAPASRILAFTGNFSGRTCTLTQISDKPALREGIPLSLQIDYLPFFNPTQPEESIKNTLTQLNVYLNRYPKQHALLLCELIQGEGGFYPGNREFFETIFKRCKEAGIVIIADEVQSFGRTTRPFAFQHFGLDTYIDIVTAGKMLQVCATLYRPSLAPRAGLLSQTFTGSSSALYGAESILKELLNGGYFGADGKNQRIGNYFRTELTKLSKEHPDLIQGPFGIGSMIAFTPFSGSAKEVQQVLQQLFKNGVIAFSAGQNPSRIRLLPPICSCDETVCKKILSIIASTLLELRG